jgi:hypothetical protein
MTDKTDPVTCLALPIFPAASLPLPLSRSEVQTRTAYT